MGTSGGAIMESPPHDRKAVKRIVANVARGLRSKT